MKCIRLFTYLIGFYSKSTFVLLMKDKSSMFRSVVEQTGSWAASEPVVVLPIDRTVELYR